MKKYFLFFILILLVSSQKNNKMTFQTTIFSHLYKKPNENICISPLSIYQIISLVSNGAIEKTQEEIFKALIPDGKINKKTQLALNANNQQIIKYYNSKNKRVRIANAVMTKDPLQESFKKICKKYDASIDRLINAEQVNKWCNEKTNGKIKKIIDELNEDTRMILINAIYLKANWKEPFEKKNTEKRNFKNSNGEIVNVETMKAEYDLIKYYKDEKIEMIELPYDDENLSMIILLPNSKKYSSTLNYIQKEKIDFTKLINKLHNTKNVILYLPKFEFEYSSKLNEALQKMNMKLAFNSNAAKFYKLNIGERLYINSVIHKTYIKVDELGTEAAAVTAIDMKENTSAPDEEIKYIYMKVEHSFIYMIKDKRIKDTNGNNLLLFIAVNNLKEENKK